MMKRSMGLRVALLVLLGVSPGFADDAGQRAAAEALFEEGRAALLAGEIVQACERFESSQRVDPGLGTLLYLADCYERAGRTASAWATFRETKSLAEQAGQLERAEIAEARAAALAPKLCRVTLLPNGGAAPPGLELSVDGAVLPSSSWGVALPVDPGTHRLVARAPNHQSWTLELRVEPEQTEYTVRVPPLVREVEVAPLGPSAVGSARGAAWAGPRRRAVPGEEGTWDATPGWSVQHTAAVTTGAVGLLSVGASAFFGLRARAHNEASLEACSRVDPTRCTARGVEQREDALASARLATITLAAGAGLLAAGGALWLTAPRETDSAVSPGGAKRTAAVRATAVEVALSGSGGGVAIGGTWW